MAVAAVNRASSINARLAQLREILLPHDKRIEKICYGSISIKVVENNKYLRHHLNMLCASMVMAMRDGLDDLEMIAGFIETMFLLVEKYDTEYGESEVVLQFDEICSKVPQEHRDLVEQAWDAVAVMQM